MDANNSSVRVALDGFEPIKKSSKSVPLHRCRFPDHTPASITSLSLTPSSFDARVLGCGASERGVLAVGRSNGQVELMVWGGYPGWVLWRTLPSSFPVPDSSSSSSSGRKPAVSLLSHLTWTHQTTLSSADLAMYSDDVEEASKEVDSLTRGGKGLRLFGVGGLGSELVEWEWGGPGSGKAVGMIKSTLPTLPPIFALSASPTSSTLAIACEDSTIRLLNILDGELELVNKIEVGGPGKVRALSLAWGPPKPFHLDLDDGDDDDEDMQVEGTRAKSTNPLAKFATRPESYLLAGCSNSTIRRFDAPATSSGLGPWRGTLRMTLDRLKGEHTVVWALSTLKDGTVVSGDSMGNVKFWDGEMGTQLQSFKGHKADVLCLAVGTDGSSIFTSGIDQKTVEFRQVAVARSRDHDVAANARWIQSSGRRLHSHDVRAIVVSPPYEPFASASTSSSASTSNKSSLVPVMTSAGLDLSLILTPVANPIPSSSSSKRQLPPANPVSNNVAITFEHTVHRRASYVPQRSGPFSVTTQPSKDLGRLLIGRRERSVGIWRLGQPSTTAERVPEDESHSEADSEDDEDDVAARRTQSGGWEKLIDLEFKTQTNLIASAISPNGKWLAVSDLYETKLYRLSTASRSRDLVPKRQKTFLSTLAASISTSLGTGSSCIQFSADSDRLLLSSAFESTVVAIELRQEEDFEVVAVFGAGRKAFEDKKKQANGDVEMNGRASDSDDEEDSEAGLASVSPQSSKGPGSIVAMTVSDDGKWLATADLERTVEVYDLEQRKHYLTLPTPPSVPTALTFLPSSSSIEPTLLLTFATNILLLYGLTSRRFHPWSLPLSSAKYNSLTDIREPSLGVTFEPCSATQNLVALVWGANWVAKIDLDELRNTNFGVTGTVKKNKKKQQHRLEADRKRAREEDEPLPIESSVAGGAAAAMVDIKVTRKYQPLYLFEFISTDLSTTKAGRTTTKSNKKVQSELVAVERTWYDLVGDLPQAWIKSGSFGT